MKWFRTSNIDTVKTCQLQFTFDLPSVIIEKRAKKFEDSLTKVKYSYTNRVWDLWGCWHSTVYSVIYLCDWDHISCIHRCFAVLIWEQKLLAVWLCDNEPFVFNVFKFYLSCSFSIIQLLYCLLYYHLWWNKGFQNDFCSFRRVIWLLTQRFKLLSIFLHLLKDVGLLYVKFQQEVVFVAVSASHMHSEP